MDYFPKLSIWENAACVVIACCIAPVFLSENIANSIGYQFLYLITAMIMSMVLRFMLVDYLLRVVKCKPEELADADSIFMTVEGVKIHYKVHRPSHGRIKRGIHLLHGTGNALYAWENVMDVLAEQCDAVVTASDLIAHGFSARPFMNRFYSRETNGHIARAIIEHELKKSASNGSEITEIVMIGNSIGGLISMMEAVRNPKNVSAVIATSPVPIPLDPINEKLPLGSITRLAAAGRYIAKEYIIGSIKALFGLLMIPIIVSLLQRTLRTKKGWRKKLSNAFAVPEALERALDHFRVGTFVRGSEYSLYKFGKLCVYNDPKRSLSDILYNRPAIDFAAQIEETARKYGVRFLIIHGEKDSIVPISGSESLCKRVPEVKLIKYPCAHVANEELKEQFVRDVIVFLKN